MSKWWQQLSTDFSEFTARQKGYFSAAQAKLAGHDEASQNEHVSKGEWVAQGPGVFRLAANDPIAKPEWLIMHVLNCDADGVPRGVFGYETAMQIFALSCQGNAKTQMFVPIGFARPQALPDYVQLHERSEHQPDEVTEKWAVPVTTPIRTIVDLLVRGGNDGTLLRLGLSEALKRQLVTEEQLSDKSLPASERALLDELVKELSLVDAADQGIA